MRALVIFPARARWTPHLVEAPVPRPPRARQVQVQVEQVGVCPFDHSLLVRHEGLSPDPERWVVGHEMVGRVTAAGREVRTLKVGDWVIPTLRRSCGVCAPCAQGYPDECGTNLYAEPGLHRAHGWACQWTLDREEHLIVISPAIADIALLAEPLALAIKGAHYLTTVQRRTLPSCSHFEHRWDQPRWAGDKHLLVAGSSVLTLVTALYLRSLGAQVTLYPTQPLPQALTDLLTRAGITPWATHKQDNSAVEQLEPADALVDTSGDLSVVASLLGRIHFNGAVVLLLAPAPPGRRPHDTNFSILLLEAVRRNIALVPCYRMGRPHLELAVQWLQDAMRNPSTALPTLVDKPSPPGNFAALVRSPASWLKSRITWAESPSNPSAKV
ncbi:MAG: alcohol dehydrogenase catalytic domain-containing protein [Dehalococcoidia bacterium]|nr:alcohol dehydrogenase catalytic domain-containing protein [Dehalococcoidia bacterium]MDW8119248.1 alcohol dehydrogenase catalytic domain-containing protein [Chloroflexota bacterium]